jgi:hypothetical protein
MRAKLFVGNLNYETSVEDLEAVFRPFPGYMLTKVRSRALVCLCGFWWRMALFTAMIRPNARVEPPVLQGDM